MEQVPDYRYNPASLTAPARPLSNHPLLRKASAALFALVGLFILLTFRHYGISNDEEVQHVYGRLLLDFYASGFNDQAAFSYRNLYLYGGFFDLIAASLERLLNLEPASLWIWDIRHLLSALFGFAGIVAVFKIAELLGGIRAAFIAALLLALTGAYSGAMFTHTKDVPFAACMAWALYYTMLIAQQLPRFPLALSIKLGIAVGCAVGLRIGAAFAVIYLLLMLAVATLSYRGTSREKLAFIGMSVGSLVPSGIVALLLMALFWPWGVMSPENPLEAAKAFSHFTFNMLTIMDGEVMNIGNVPRDYLLAYLLVRLPEAFLLGLAGFMVFGWKPILQAGRSDRLAWFTLGIAVLFPLGFILLDKPALYNGIRHFTFLLPPLAVLAGLGLSFAWDRLAHRGKLRTALTAAVIALCVLTTVTLARLHPYEYIYYNHLAGSLAEAEREWEADYWSSSLREAADMLEAQVPGVNKADPSADYLVAVCAESVQGDAYLDDRFEITRDWVAADFFISTTNMNCDKVLQGKVIGTVERMGTVLAVIKDRRTLKDLQRQPRRVPQHTQ
jgi:hypothetical protein